MSPRIELLPETKLVGKRIETSLAINRTQDLWRNFVPRRKEIRHNVGNNLFSVERYPLSYFDHFNPEATFEKWAAVEVYDFKEIPEGLEILTIPEGWYAVFLHKGPASSGPKTYQYIFGTWLPGSDYLLDSRPHLAIMGEKYKHEDPDSEEELWIPVKLRNKAVITGDTAHYTISDRISRVLS